MEDLSRPANEPRLSQQFTRRGLTSFLYAACLPLAIACGSSDRNNLTPLRSYSDPSFHADRTVRDGSCIIEVVVNDQGTRKIEAIRPSGCQRDSERSVLQRAWFNIRYMVGLS